jgi:hypothetical protein
MVPQGFQGLPFKAELGYEKLKEGDTVPPYGRG